MAAMNRVPFERDDLQLRRRPAQERSDENSSSMSPPVSDTRACLARGKAGLDLEVRAAARRQRALGGDAAAGDEERARMSRLRGGRDDAALDSARRRASRSSSLHTRSSACSRSRSRAASS